VSGSRPNLLLATSAVVYFAAALPLLFAPEETAAALGAAPDAGRDVLSQVVGGALLGFAMLNWANRHSKLGGIFGRPLVLANLSHAATAFLVLARPAARSPGELALSVSAAAYLVLAVAFGSRLFVSPEK
jgi:hypothetical protein